MNNWIITKEAQPTAFGQYIAQIRGAKVPTALYYNPLLKEWSDIHGVVYRVIAWQPFPPAYKKEEENEQ